MNIFRFLQDLWWRWIYHQEWKEKEKDPEHLMTAWEYSQWVKKQKGDE